MENKAEDIYSEIQDLNNAIKLIGRCRDYDIEKYEKTIKENEEEIIKYEGELKKWKNNEKRLQETKDVLHACKWSKECRLRYIDEAKKKYEDSKKKYEEKIADLERKYIDLVY